MVEVQKLLPPSETVYIRNLKEDVKLNILKQEIQNIFKPYGEILQIIANKNIRMRGQAFVVFADVDGAQRAIDSVQGYALHDKPMVLNFAKTPSNMSILKRYGENSAPYQKHMAETAKRKGLFNPVSQ